MPFCRHLAVMLKTRANELNSIFITTCTPNSAPPLNISYFRADPRALQSTVVSRLKKLTYHGFDITGFSMRDRHMNASSGRARTLLLKNL